MTLTVFNNVAIMLVYMLLGYIICKNGLCNPAHGKSLSAILIYILGPCMIINAFIKTDFSTEVAISIGLFFVVTLIIQLLFFICLYLLFHKKYTNPKYRIMSLAAVLGNVGFFGLPLITGIFPDKPIVACYSSIHVMSMNLLVFTMGEYLITNDKKYISLKGAIINPTTIAIIISLPLFVFDIQPISILMTPIEMLGKMVTPVCMLVLGMRLSTIELKSLFTQKFVYMACLLKLIIFPTFAFVCVKLLPMLSTDFKTSVVVLACAPAGAVISSLSEIHECEQDLTANAVLLTTIGSILTIPLMVTCLINFI